MLTGHVDSVTREAIIGWAADTDKPDSPVSVRVAIDERMVQVTADEMREDLRAAFPGATGRYGFRATEHLFPISPFTPHTIKVTFPQNGALLPRGEHTLAPAGSGPRAPSRFTPIAVSGTGRSGTSLLMARLARHPDIVVARGHPHEVCLLSYYAMAFLTLTAEADRERSTKPDTMTGLRHRFFIGSNPYFDAEDRANPALLDFWRNVMPDRLADCYVDTITTYYETVARTLGKSGARYFAEKTSSSELARESAGYFFGEAREILLVRDLRDILCSSERFWKSSEAQPLMSLKGQYNTLARPRRDRGLRQLVVRYEDLVLRPDETMTTVFRFLELDPALAPRDVERESLVFRTHGTSPMVEASIGRWRRQLSPEDAAHATEVLRPHLERFGYPLA